MAEKLVTTKQKLRVVASRFSMIIDTTAKLVEMLEARDNRETPAMKFAFGETAKLLEALPLDASDMCYFRNRLPSTRQLAASEERADRNTALVQMREMSRKLTNCAEEWR